MNKIGYLIDDKIKKTEQMPEGEKKDKAMEKHEEYHKIFKKFEDLCNIDNTIISKRV